MVDELYIKVNLTSKEKLNLLLFDLLPERILKREIIYKYNKEVTIKEEDDIKSNNSKKDECVMPFFDNIDEGDSNF